MKVHYKKSCIAVLAISLTLLNFSCQSGTAFQKPQPKNITAAELAKLRWIEGAWRGTGDIAKPFFERYHFENDTTLVMESLADESLTKVNRVTRYELKDGQFSDGHYVATAMDDSSITFDPLVPGINSFRWQRESDHSWKAILTLPASGSTPTKQTNYLLERITEKGK